MNEDQVKEVYQAYLFGAQAHEGQYRKTGEPYIYHPISVARILAEMHMDSKSICAAILHDVIEDTPATKEEVAESLVKMLLSWLMVSANSPNSNLKIKKNSRLLIYKKY